MRGAGIRVGMRVWMNKLMDADEFDDRERRVVVITLFSYIFCGILSRLRYREK